MGSCSKEGGHVVAGVLEAERFMARCHVEEEKKSAQRHVPQMHPKAEGGGGAGAY